MKFKMLFLLIFLALNTFANETTPQEVNFRFWDGTFAYNELVVVSQPHQPNLLKVTLKGSQINLGAQIEGTQLVWSWRDRLELFVKRDDCEINHEEETVSCQIERASVSELTWMVNSKIRKTYDGLINDVVISGSKQAVSVSFNIPGDEDFTPVNPRIDVNFFTTFF